ncbi:MAG: dihydropyrimidinase [Anaerolineae bacterium]|nr:dihydropyrimidinase [Thermoflexales bacterium]MDW8406258.1 dihydropyrimidinase [Anaerolineae bacterium]
MEFDLIVRGGTVVTADATFAADVAVQDGKIAAVLPHSPIPDLKSKAVLDASGCYVLPGAIDAHVHLHMPTSVGYTADDWETGTRAAALGGTTCIVDFVETEPGESLIDALHKRLEEARAAVIDFGLHMTVQPDEHVIAGVPRRVSERRIREMRAAYEAGCATFKLYMAYPGFQIGDGDLLRALRTVAELNALACIHAENGDVIEVLRRSVQDQPELAIHHARTRPPVSEREAVSRAVVCAELSGARVLIFHLGCEAAARVVAEAKAAGNQRVFGETCPHYLALTEDYLARADGRLWVCAPPLRPQADQEAMWHMLASRALDIVSTDHCPFTKAQKDAGKTDFRAAPGGVPGIETRLGLMYECGVRQGRLTLNDWVRVCCTRPAELHALPHKGRIAVGCDADLVVFDPTIRKSLTADKLHSALDWSAYSDMTCAGWPRDVIARGELIVRDQKWVGRPGRGRFLQRAF